MGAWPCTIQRTDKDTGATVHPSGGTLSPPIPASRVAEPGKRRCAGEAGRGRGLWWFAGMDWEVERGKDRRRQGRCAQRKRPHEVPESWERRVPFCYDVVERYNVYLRTPGSLFCCFTCPTSIIPCIPGIYAIEDVRVHSSISSHSVNMYNHLLSFLSGLIPLTSAVWSE